MRPNLSNMRVLLGRHCVAGVCLIAVVCSLSLTARAMAPERTRVGGAAEGRSGPTVILSYSADASEKNPISSFMYFVPLLSRTVVERQTSAENEAEVEIVSHHQEIGTTSFYVACEFAIRGTGVHKNIFDPAGMIAAGTLQLKENESLTGVLDYIKCEGEGIGRIEVEGTISDSRETVTQINLRFNARKQKSPVTIGLYDVEPEDGEYKYENRSNELVARVNTLTFTKSDASPRMGVSVASIARGAASDGFIARVKGQVANMFIKPPKIDILGNDTMLDFGYAILKQQREFTFPRATNIKKHTRVAALAPDP
jgi:hypothetical protein